MYRFEKDDFFDKYYFVIADIICMQLLFLIPYFLGKWTSAFIKMQVLITLIYVCVLFFTEALQGIYTRGYFKEAKNVFVSQSITFSILLVLLFLEKSSSDYSRESTFLMYIGALILVYAERIIVKKISIRYFKEKKNPRSILIVTTIQRAEETLTTVLTHKFSDFRVTGIGLINKDGSEINKEKILHVPIVAHDKEILDYIKKNVVDEVFLDVPSGYDHINDLTTACNDMGVVIHYKLDNFTKGARNIVEEFGGYNVLTSSANIVSSRQLFIKRTIDIIGSLVGIVITGILFLFVAPAIYIKSPGPIFFSQERVGLNGRRFKVYKFRSMYMDAEERKAALLEQNKMDGFMFKIDDDPRIIKGIGNFIRKTSIDEFPQMWNVLKGDMSLVGTRPPTVDEFEKYEYHHKSRLATKPGITGMWQVNGRSNITDFEQVVALDNQYIQNWSLALDFRILLKTVMVVLNKEGSV